MPDTEKTQFPGVRSATSGQRYYSPSLGRFVNKDPIEEKGGLNLYGFCRNNGANRWDYLGNTVPWWMPSGYVLPTTSGQVSANSPDALPTTTIQHATGSLINAAAVAGTTYNRYAPPVKSAGLSALVFAGVLAVPPDTAPFAVAYFGYNALASGIQGLASIAYNLSGNPDAGASIMAVDTNPISVLGNATAAYTNTPSIAVATNVAVPALNVYGDLASTTSPASLADGFGGIGSLPGDVHETVKALGEGLAALSEEK